MAIFKYYYAIIIYDHFDLGTLEFFHAWHAVQWLWTKLMYRIILKSHNEMKSHNERHSYGPDKLS